MNCEFCGKSCSEFGDLAGAIVCGDCLLWYGNGVNTEIPQELLDRQEAIDILASQHELAQAEIERLNKIIRA